MITVLDLCGGTGSWSKPWADAGYNVIIVDPKVGGTDVRLFQPPENVYCVLAAPPCTVFSGSGARWKRTDDDMREGLSVVDACLRIIHTTKPHVWALENPVGILRNYIGPPVAYFNPCDYGDPYTKKTCLWGKFTIPDKSPVAPTEGSKMHLKYGGKSDRTKTIRSQTPPGFARAFFEANRGLI
jgi:site-specific DNA-cytosine methylase